MANIAFYPEGNKVLPSDDEMRTLHKIAFNGSSGSGGGSGSSLQQIYLNRNPAAPDDPTKPAASYNTTTQVITWWNLTTWE